MWATKTGHVQDVHCLWHTEFQYFVNSYLFKAGIVLDMHTAQLSLMVCGPYY